MESENFHKTRRFKKATHSKKEDEYLMDDDNQFDELLQPRRKSNLKGLLTVGTGVVIGGGLGLIAGIATVAVTATVSKIVIGGLSPKITGVIGGALGLRWGLRKTSKKK